MATEDDWIADARRTLLGCAAVGGGWGYRRGVAASSEPTALAGLALLATRPAAGGDSTEGRALAAASDRLAAMQRPDGSVGVSAAIPSPGWATPMALLFWEAAGSHADRRRSAVRWLLGQKGRTLAPGDDPKHVAGHDTTLVGWPWVADTHSWLEPTAMAVLALSRAGSAGHDRVRQGLRLVRDRAIDSGGWNYGNKAVFGRSLRAQPAPTGLALLALAGVDPRTPTVARATRYLRATLPGVRASASLGWGLAGLSAWGERPAEADAWLSEAYAAVKNRPDAPARVACLLLGAGEDTLRVLGRPADAPVALAPTKPRVP